MLMYRSRKLKHVFQRQDAACAFADAGGASAGLRVFSREKMDSNTGSRSFVVASYSEFWKVYKVLPPEARVYYELIREHDPCCLYFDIEYSRTLNPGVEESNMMRLLREQLFASLKSELGLSVSATDLVDLDASNTAKFSRHWIVRTAVFRTNMHAGHFVRQLMIKLYGLSLSHSPQFAVFFLPVRFTIVLSAQETDFEIAEFPYESERQFFFSSLGSASSALVTSSSSTNSKFYSHSCSC